MKMSRDATGYRQSLSRLYTLCFGSIMKCHMSPCASHNCYVSKTGRDAQDHCSVDQLPMHVSDTSNLSGGFRYFIVFFYYYCLLLHAAVMVVNFDNVLFLHKLLEYMYIYIYISGGPLSVLTCCVNARLLSAIKKIWPLIYSQSWDGSWVYTTQAMMTFTLIF